MWLSCLLIVHRMLAAHADLVVTYDGQNCTLCPGQRNVPFVCPRNEYNTSAIADWFKEQCRLKNNMKYDRGMHCALADAADRENSPSNGLYWLHYLDVYEEHPEWAAYEFSLKYWGLPNDICENLKHKPPSRVMCGVYQQDDFLGAFVGVDGRYLYCLFR